MLSTWTLVAAADKGVDANGAVHQAGLIAVGAMLQTLIALIASPLRFKTPQKRATAHALTQLAACARRPDPDLLEATAAALPEAATVARESADAPRQLVEQAELVRAQITALARTASGDNIRAAAADALTTPAGGGKPAFPEMRPHRPH